MTQSRQVAAPAQGGPENDNSNQGKETQKKQGKDIFSCSKWKLLTEIMRHNVKQNPLKTWHGFCIFCIKAKEEYFLS